MKLRGEERMWGSKDLEKTGDVDWWRKCARDWEFTEWRLKVERKRRRQERLEEKIQERKEIRRYEDEKINRIYHSDYDSRMQNREYLVKQESQERGGRGYGWWGKEREKRSEESV